VDVMNRKVSALVAMIFALGLPVEAQQPAKVHRVGRLSAGSPADPLTKESFETFRQGLHDLGLDRRPKHRPRWVGEKPERLRDLAAELVRLRVDWESEGWKSGLRHGRSGSCASCGIRC
jgi:hypothetical protein